MSQVKNTRRQLLKGMAASTLAMPAILRRTKAFAQGPVRIGFVTPQTGPLAFFGEPDEFALGRFAEQIAEGVAVRGSTRPIEFLIKDSQSNPNRAAELAAQLILGDEVDLLVTAGAPDTVVPVAGQAEINETPLVSNACPWQPFVFERGSTPEQGFDWTYLFAFGLEDMIAAYLALWKPIETNQKVGLLFANDADGNAWGDAQFGFPPALAEAGYEVFDSGRFSPMAEDFTAQISTFKSAGVDIVMGTMIPPEFFAFWSQAAQQGLRPKVATIGKTLLLPTTLEAIGDIGDGLSTEIAWHPTFPFTSALTGDTPPGLVAAWEAETSKQWTQPIGLKHALFDVALDLVARADDPTDRDAVVEAIRKTDHETVLGRVNWSTSPIKNVAKMPFVSGQWRRTDGKFELVICANPTPEPIPVTGGVLALD